MKLGNVNQNTTDDLRRQSQSNRHTLLMVIIFTAVNLAMLVSDAGRYFLFSASVPYYLTAFCIGMDYGLGVDGIGRFTTVALVISAVIIAVYLLCWLLGKKKSGWYVVALVMFTLDTLVLLAMTLLLDIFTESIMDLVFHAMVIFSLFQLIAAEKKMKKNAVQEAPKEVDPWDQVSVQ